MIFFSYSRWQSFKVHCNMAEDFNFSCSGNVLGIGLPLQTLSNGLDNPNNNSKETLQKPVLHIEILQQNHSTLPPQNVVLLAHRVLKNCTITVEDLCLTEFEDPELHQHVKSISIGDISISTFDGKGVTLENAKLSYHTYRLNNDSPGIEDMENEELSAATHWILPSSDFYGLWESLIYDSDIKSQLLNFVSTTLLFTDKKVDTNIITWNRVVLLHGPPGTGKTSLCKALAQKLCIRLGANYSYGQLIEINSHSLFSKWFSESGKLVMKMFQKIQEIIDDPEALVFVLIDEVESLAHSRKASLGGVEPSDSVRVVNALLTQIDQIRRYPNVIILTTSNITEAIDLAFVDRADIKHYIGLPSVGAIYQIYYTCIKELQRANIIYTKETIFPLRQLNMTGVYESEITSYSLRLRDIARQSEGLSGRTLRKLPFLAYALYIQVSSVTLDDFLEALTKAVVKQFQEREDMKATDT